MNYERPTPQDKLPCTIEGCELKRSSKGLCSKHVYRLKKHGSPHVAAFHVEKHGMLDHPLYSTWVNMRRRCHSPSATGYKLYGGRGIQVCDRWRNSFAAFVEDVGDRPPGRTLDRVDNSGHYEPGNVRWASAVTQVKNRRTNQDSVSGHKGVSWDATQSRWRAYAGGGSSRVELGYFRELSDAIEARHQATVDDPEMVCCAVLNEMRQLAS